MGTFRTTKMASTGGGLFGQQKTTGISKETQDVLKVMMQESKLTSLQQRKLQESVQAGRSLPLRCGPTSSQPKRPGGGSKEKGKQSVLSQSGRGKRTKDAILEREAGLDQDAVQCDRPPCSRFDSSKEKQRLQNIMSFGSETEGPKVASSLPAQKDEPEMDRFDEVLGEIEERRQFLADMECLGQDRAYRSQIETEISQKIRELEVIDRERCRALSEAMNQEK